MLKVALIWQVRVACIRFIDHGDDDDVSDAVDRLFSEHILRHASALAMTDGDVFRRLRLYTQETLNVFQTYEALLMRVFEAYTKDKSDVLLGVVSRECGPAI